MQKQRAERNKTLILSKEQEEAYYAKCIRENDIAGNNIINKTICGDTFAILPKLPRGFVDLLIVDPPYNLSKDYHGKKFCATDNQSYAEYTKKWIEAVIPMLKPTASVYVCCDWKSSLVIGPVLQKYFVVRNRITWQREKGRGASKNWKNGMEDIWFATVSDEYTFNLEAVKIRKRVIAPYRENGKPKDWEETAEGNFRNTCPSNFWDDISIPYWSMPENTDHPTQKPEKLMAKLILASSNVEDTVFDPFSGSGTTLVAAKKLGRKYVGIEHNETYCAWGEKRLEDANKDQSIQGYSDGIFWERNTLNVQKKS